VAGEHRSGFVAVVGRPNAGKSTLLNLLLEQKIAAVSPRPQTTRRRQLGILSRENAQIIFIDTPGIHKSVNRLGEWMVQSAMDAVRNADLTLWLVDGAARPATDDQIAGERLSQSGKEVILALNKADQVEEGLREKRAAAYRPLAPAAELRWISARSGEGCQELVERLIELLPEGPQLYDEEQITDLYEREIAVDLIREALLLSLDDEVPHSTAVRLEEYSDRGEEAAYLSATLLVEREAHKGIVIGRGGEMLKRIGTLARREIEALTGRKVYLELRVKTLANWRNNPILLNQLGYHTDRKL